MATRLCRGLLFIGLVGMSVPLLEAQECRDGVASLGVGSFYCRGGSCRLGGASVNARASAVGPEVAGAMTVFTVEPSLWDIAADGPAVGKLAEGDVLVAVNQRPITSWAGSRALERIRAGTEVLLTVRRGGRLHEVGVIPSRSCRQVRLVAGSSAVPPGDLTPLQMAQPSTPPGVSAPARLSGMMGITFSCELCGWRADGNSPPRWHFPTPPVVIAVDEGGPAQRSGLIVGDVLTHIEGAALTTEEGARRFSTLSPGETIRIDFTRGGEPRSVRITTVAAR